MRDTSKRSGGLLRWFFVVLSISTLVIQALPSRASATPIAQLGSLTLQARIWSEYQMLLNNQCAWKGGPPDSEVVRPSWFGSNANVGLHVENEDGTIQCDNSGWLAEILTTATGSTDYKSIYDKVGHNPASSKSSSLANYLTPYLFGGGNTDSQGASNQINVQAIQYQILMYAFTDAKGCNAKVQPGNAVPNDQTQAIISTYSNNAVQQVKYIYNSDDNDKGVPVGFGFGDSDGKYECQTIANKLADASFAKAAQAWAAANPGGSLDLNSAGSNAQKKTCESVSGITIAWIICPLIKLIDGIISTLDSAIQNLLIIDPKQYGDQKVKDAWATMRNIALAILLPIMLVMVAATALDWGPVDPYTAKKAFPRFVFAVFFILLSYPFTVFLVELSNAAGAGTLGLISAAFGSGAAQGGTLSLASLLSGGEAGGIFTGLIVGGLAAGAVGAVTLGMFGSFALIAAVGMFIGFLVLVLRQVVILAGIILAPVAILSWIFPGNDKLWKLWRESFEKALLFFVIFMAVLGVGRAGASLVSGNATNAGIIGPFMVVIMYVGPYFLIKQIASMGGTALGALSGVVNDRGRGFFDNQRKRRAESVKAARERAQGGNRFQAKNRFASSLNRGIERATNLQKAGKNPLRMRGRLNEALSRSTYDEAKELREKSSEFAAISQDDDLLRVAAQARSRGDIDRMLRAAGRYTPEAAARVEAVQRLGSAEAVAMAATTQLAATGTGYETSGEMLGAIARVTHGDRDSATRMLGDMRSLASGSRRVDLGGAGFGATQQELFSVMGAMGGGAATFQAAQDASTATLRREAYRGQGGGAVVTGRRNSLEQLAPAMLDEINQTIARGDSHGLTRQMAALAGRYDAAAQASPENAEVLADHVMGTQYMPGRMNPASQTTQVLQNALNYHNNQRALAAAQAGAPAPAALDHVSAREVMEYMRNDPNFLDMRREYGAQATAQAAAAAVQGGAGAGGGPGGAGSDIRFKENIHHVGTDPHTGLNLYRFSYKWAPEEYVGVMAQEVLRVAPEAVHADQFGYYYVDYSALGLQMQAYDDWLNAN